MSDASPESNTHVFTLTMDWLAFTLPDVSAQEVMRQIGGEWTKGKAGFRGYPLSWILTDTSRGVGMLGTGARVNLEKCMPISPPALSLHGIAAECGTSFSGSSTMRAISHESTVHWMIV